MFVLVEYLGFLIFSCLLTELKIIVLARSQMKDNNVFVRPPRFATLFPGL